MRKIIISAALAAAATVTAAPAIAQPGYQGYPHPGQMGYNNRGRHEHMIRELERELQQIEQRINRQAHRGRISRREATGLYREIGRIRTQLDRASRHGLSGREYGYIRSRIQELRQRFREERQDYDGRRDRW
jgi:Spy/CpxP family protein refolding chaperone